MLTDADTPRDMHQASIEKIEGFILSRQWDDVSQKKILGVSKRPDKHLRLVYWLKTDEGPLRLVIDTEKSVFFLPRPIVDQCLNLLRRCPKLSADDYYCRPLTLKTFQGEPVDAFYFSQQRSLYFARDFLKKHHIIPLEADIQPTERFLMERFVTGAASLEGAISRRGQYLDLSNPRIKAVDYSPALCVMSVDIETSIYDDQLYSIAAYVQTYAHGERKVNLNDAEQARVFMCGDQQCASSFLSLYPNEKSLFSAFMAWFNHVDPDVIIGWNVINFDLRFLQRKSQSLGMSFLLGRDNTPVDWRQSKEDSHHYTLTVPGRAVLDGIDTLKSATYQFESFSLQNVANVLLKRGKRIHDVDDRGQEITRLFNENKRELAEYNLEDCRLVWDIFCHADLIRFALERAKMTGLALDRFGGSVAAFDNQYLPRLHRKGYVAPENRGQVSGLGSPGGYVMESSPGIYNNILVLDFKSLYPSIIRTFKIDPLALALYEQEQDPEHNPAIDVYVPGFNGASFHKQHAILPAMIGELWDLRDTAKTHKHEAMSRAIKILMNSFYGVLGTSGCRFFDDRLAGSITLRGHDILQTTKTLVENSGYQVIYGDTDSLFVWVRQGLTDHQALFELGAELTESLNQWWQEHLAETYDLHSYLELEFESCFSRFVMPTIRGTETGSKKRYAGCQLMKDGSISPELVFKGLEAVRTDWTELAREFQRELYRRIFFEEPYEDYIREIVSEIYDGKHDAKLVYRKRIRRRLEDYTRQVPPHIQASRLAEANLSNSGQPSRYRRGAWIRYVVTVNGPEPLEYRRSVIDYERYVDRQIAPIVDGILHFLGHSFDSVAGQQLGFFDNADK